MPFSDEESRKKNREINGVKKLDTTYIRLQNVSSIWS